MILSSAKKIKIRPALPKKLKWGIAGCSKFAETVFLPSLQFLKRSRLVSIYSHDMGRAKSFSQKFGAQNSFDDFDEFLKSDIDAVYISGKNTDHHWQAVKAAEAGKHILCEKPIAINSDQIIEMVDAAKKNNVQLVINHLHRFHPHVLKAKELLDKQILGKIVSISASYHLNRTPDDSFRFKKESGGGALRDLGSQMIDLLHFLGGDFLEVKSYVDNIIYKSEVEDFVSAVLKYEKSGYAYFNTSYDSKKPFIRAEVVGHNGSISIDSYLDKKSLVSKLTIDLQGEARKVFRKRTNKITFMLRSVQRCFMRNRPAIVTGEDGLFNMKIIEEIERQSRG